MKPAALSQESPTPQTVVPHCASIHLLSFPRDHQCKDDGYRMASHKKKEEQLKLQEEERLRKLAEFQKQEEKQEKERAAQTEELQRLRAIKHQGYTKATEIDLSKKFENTEEFINT